MKRALIVFAICFLLAYGCAKTDTSQKNAIDTSYANNKFFFANTDSKLAYKGTFLFDDMIEQDVTLNIKEIVDLTYGKLYELKLEHIEDVPDERLSLGYFYVQEDKIYKMDPSEENLGNLKTSEQLPVYSMIVCQDKEIKDTLWEDEPGFHQYLDINGDRREFHSYNNQVSTGYYESYTWEKTKGLIYYESGYGAGRDSIALALID